MESEIKNLTAVSFAEYGRIIEFSEGFDGFFEIVISEEEKPWRLAVYRPSKRTFTFMENHPDSMESFEPVKGIALLMVAKNNSPHEYEIFLLDKPVCLYKGIWHDVVSLSEDILIKISENHQVTSEFYYFDEEKRVIIS